MAPESGVGEAVRRAGFGRSDTLRRGDAYNFHERDYRLFPAGGDTAFSGAESDRAGVAYGSVAAGDRRLFNFAFVRACAAAARTNGGRWREPYVYLCGDDDLRTGDAGVDWGLLQLSI